MKKILVTGAHGFIGRNLVLKLSENEDIEVITYTRDDNLESLDQKITSSDVIIHLAGENRPKETDLFESVNVGLTRTICETLDRYNIKSPLIYASSTQAVLDNPYGKSKLAAEEIIVSLSKNNGNPVNIFRLPSVFGKWCKPEYNSVVATFCHNIANDIPIKIDNPDTVIKIIHIDDVLYEFVDYLKHPKKGLVKGKVAPEYSITLNELAETIKSFKKSRENLVTEPVGKGFIRALYSTYISYLLPKDFIYELKSHTDERGSFVEMLKTHDSGQFSFFTLHPGLTRGDHYHHTKTEKFLVLKGKALFSFRHVITNEIKEFNITGDNSRIIQSIPGWSHNITNIGDSEMIVMLWANEIFNRRKPDTYACEV